MGLKTSLGVSNISFGLPSRNLINSVFFANALQSGLSCAIMNPFSPEMMSAYFSFRVLNNLDPSCTDFIAYASGISEKQAAAPQKSEMSLKETIVKGLAEASVTKASELILNVAPLDIINDEIIPALDTVGKAFEEKKLFLPQLLMSADAANAAFSIIKEKINSPSQNEGEPEK